MNINTVDAQTLYTKTLVGTYKERIRPKAFLRSFFKDVPPVPSLEISIEVQRGFEKVAVDVTRGSDGNLNGFNRSTEKIIIPPYFREYFPLTSLQFYDRLYGATSITDAAFTALINDTTIKMGQLQDKIERAYELFCAQVLTTGVVLLDAASDIDFRRKAASLVDPGAGQYFANAINPFTLFENGANFLRQVGKSQGGVFNAILGSQALTDLLANVQFNDRQNRFNMKLDDVIAPQRQAIGSSFHGAITAGTYTILLWSYPEFYDNASSVSTPYVDPKKVIMLPQSPDFVMSYAACPQLLSPNTPPVTGAFIFSDYIDERKRAHEYHCESAGLPVPVAIDQIYTFKAVA